MNDQDKISKPDKKEEYREPSPWLRGSFAGSLGVMILFGLLINLEPQYCSVKSKNSIRWGVWEVWEVWGELSNSPIFVFPLFPLLSQLINFENLRSIAWSPT